MYENIAHVDDLTPRKVGNLFTRGWTDLGRSFANDLNQMSDGQAQIFIVIKSPTIERLHLGQRLPCVVEHVTQVHPVFVFRRHRAPAIVR